MGFEQGLIFKLKGKEGMLWETEVEIGRFVIPLETIYKKINEP